MDGHSSRSRLVFGQIELAKINVLKSEDWHPSVNPHFFITKFKSIVTAESSGRSRADQ